MRFKLTTIFGLFLLSFNTYGQYTPLKIIVMEKKSNAIIGDRAMVLTIDDTLTKTLKIDVDGFAEKVLVYGGFHKVKILIDQYEPLILKKIGVDDGRGRILIVKMVPITNKH